MMSYIAVFTKTNNNFTFSSKFQVYEAFQVNLDYTVLEILLGFPCERNTIMSVINFVILHGKKYTYNCKINLKLKSRIKVEIYMCKISVENNNLLEFWEKLLFQCSSFM